MLQLINKFHSLVNSNGERDPLSFCPGGVDANDLAIKIDQGSSRASTVYNTICLNVFDTGFSATDVRVFSVL